MSSLDTTFGSIINQAVLASPRLWYFFSSPSTPKFVCKTPVLPSLLQFWRCAPEEDVLVQDQFDGGEDVEGVVHHQDLSYVPEVI